MTEESNTKCLHIISRKKAKELGMKRYFSGKSCRNGHFSEKRVSNYQCIECAVMWRIANEDFIREYNKNWREENKDYLENYKQEYYKENYAKMKANRQKYYQENAEMLKRKSKEWADNNRERKRETDREYRRKNKEELKVKDMARYYRDRDKNGEKRRAYYQENKDIIKERVKAWKNDNREHSRAYYREYFKERRRTDLRYRVAYLSRSMVARLARISGEAKEQRTHQLLGYSPEELKDHLEDRFTDGMSWDRWDEIHIDHLYPVSKFIQDGITDQATINALDNLIPMWAEHNLSKGNKTLEEWLEQKGEGSREWKLYSRYL